MGSANDYQRFGQELRELRQSKNLTLSQVAELSAQVAIDPRGRISNPYLSQLELGQSRRPSLPKLLTIAAIYAAPIEKLLEHAPAQLREPLVCELAAWRRARQPEPRPLRCSRELVTRLQADMETALRVLAEDVRFPLGLEQDCLAASINAATWCTIVPWVLRQPGAPDMVRAFSDGYDRELREYLERAGPLNFRTTSWYEVASEFHRWAQFERGAGVKLIRLMKWWTLDTTSCYEAQWVFSCTFADADLDATFEVDRVPLYTLRAVRWRQLARLLFSLHLAARFPDCPEPPAVEEAAVETAGLLVDPQISVPAEHIFGRERLIAEQVAALLSSVEWLRGDASAQVVAEIRPIAAFLNRSVADLTFPRDNSAESSAPARPSDACGEARKQGRSSKR